MWLGKLPGLSVLRQGSFSILGQGAPVCCLHHYLSDGWSYLFWWSSPPGSRQGCSSGWGQVPSLDTLLGPLLGPLGSSPSPYEPLKQSSLKHLTLKTAFLVSLASGRRCSKVHTLSGLPGDVAFKPDGSMSLWFLPDFLAKHQLPGSPSPVMCIKSLSSILAPDDEDHLLCPVRALRAYRKCTKSFRPEQRRLLLSWNENYKDDIRRSTISRWLWEVITAAYVRPRSELYVFSPRPHEIRALASSLAFASNVSLSSLMDAAYWRSPGTFIHFYLRDVSRGMLLQWWPSRPSWPLRPSGCPGFPRAMLFSNEAGIANSCWVLQSFAFFPLKSFTNKLSQLLKAEELFFMRSLCDTSFI